jgi:nicotinamidase-related amidase
MTDRAEDIVSPITDGSCPDKTAVADARAQGRFGYDKPTIDNSIVLLIDHQIGLMVSTRDTTTVVELRSNALGLARLAKALELPTLISSSNAQWQNGDTIPEIKELFPDIAIIRRTGIINAYEDPTFRSAFDTVVEETGRRHVIIAGVTIGTCCTFPTLSLLNDGYQVFPVIDACGAWNKYEVDAALARMTQAGAEPVTTFALACELQEDWKHKTANAMLEPFFHNLPEYGYVAQNFWNNVGGHAVADPFDTAT